MNWCYTLTVYTFMFNPDMISLAINILSLKYSRHTDNASRGFSRDNNDILVFQEEKL